MNFGSPLINLFLSFDTCGTVFYMEDVRRWDFEVFGGWKTLAQSMIVHISMVGHLGKLSLGIMVSSLVRNHTLAQPILQSAGGLDFHRLPMLNGFLVRQNWGEEQGARGGKTFYRLIDCIVLICADRAHRKGRRRGCQLNRS